MRWLILAVLVVRPDKSSADRDNEIFCSEPANQNTGYCLEWFNSNQETTVPDESVQTTTLPTPVPIMTTTTTTSSLTPVLPSNPVYPVTNPNTNPASEPERSVATAV